MLLLISQISSVLVSSACGHSIRNLRRNTARGTSGYTHTHVKSLHAASRMICVCVCVCALVCVMCARVFVHSLVCILTWYTTYERIKHRTRHPAERWTYPVVVCVCARARARVPRLSIYRADKLTNEDT